MKKTGIILLIICSVLLVSCAPERMTTQIFGYLDTVAVIDGYFDSYKDFEAASAEVESILSEYDRLLDIHDKSSEISILNERKKLTVSNELIKVLEFGIKAHEATEGKCNIAMGSVISLWHSARMAEEHYLPDTRELGDASRHTDINDIMIEGNTVTITDPELTLDLGAVAKGYISDVIKERLTALGYDNLYVNMGGNVIAIGDKNGEGWRVGINDPNNSAELAGYVDVSNGFLVTSGVDQRYFEYDGKRYHHIISPDTLFPSESYSSVTVLTESGAWADALSTALFNMSIDEGKALLDNFENSGAVWILPNGEKISCGKLNN